MQNQVIGGILGFVVGDALGVPVEFQSREEIKADPVPLYRIARCFAIFLGVALIL